MFPVSRRTLRSSAAALWEGMPGALPARALAVAGDPDPDPGSPEPGSFSPGLPGRPWRPSVAHCGASVSPAGSRCVSAPSGTGTGRASGCFSPGLLGRLRRPSVARAARSMREAGRTATALPARAAASWRAGRDAPGRLRRGVPGMTMCGRRGAAGRLSGHIIKPGTSRWPLVLRVLGALTRLLPLSRSRAWQPSHCAS